MELNRLSEEQIESSLAEAKGWSRKDEKWIERKFRFAQFMDGIAYVQKIAEMAERYDHHPLISIDYKLVTLRLSSWNAGGLTDLDMKMAQECNELYEQSKAF